MDPFKQAAKELDRYSKKVEKAVKKAQMETAKAGLKAAIKASSGRTSLSQLRKEDHPYATRHKVAKRDASIINDQGGSFKREWKIGNSTNGPAIVNFSKVAGFLQAGTKKMVARPVEARIIDAMSQVGVANLGKSINSIKR